MIDVRTSTVRDAMVASPVITTRTTVSTALRLLREHDIAALPVCDGARFLGLVDEKALLRLTPSDASTLDVYELREVLDSLTVSRLIESVPSVSADATLEDAAILMRTGRHPVLPVMEAERFVGLLPWTAVLP
jgi:acetoin utilization protein AcuB